MSGSCVTTSSPSWIGPPSTRSCSPDSSTTPTSEFSCSQLAFSMLDSVGGGKDKVQRGAQVFDDHCAKCHSHTKYKKDPGKLEAYYQTENFLADDKRYPVTYPGLGTNMARALATNAVDHDVWAEFSSKEYKALDSIAT